MALDMNNLETIYRGDSREYNLTFTNSDNIAIDITSWKIYFTIKLSYRNGDDKAALKKDITVHDDPTNGKTKIVILPADTENIEPGNYWYDIQVRRDGESILTIAWGRIEIRVDITRRRD